MFKQVVVALDGSPESVHAAEVAVRLGIAQSGQLHVVSALDASGFVTHGLSRLNEAELATICERYRAERVAPALEQLAKRGVEIDGVHIEPGEPAETIAGLARRLEAEVVVVGRRGMGALKRLFLGSVSIRLLELCARPVLVVPEDCAIPSAGAMKVLASTDFSAEAAEGVAMAARISRSLDCELCLYHELDEAAASRADAEARLKELCGSLLEGGARATSQIGEPGGVGEVVRSSGAQLVVIASHGRSGVEKLLVGSFAASVVKQAHVPVLIVRIDREEA